MRRAVIILALLLTLAACGSRHATPPPTMLAARYTVTATVLESAAHGPQLCLGGVMDSLPPQCGGPDLVGWEWKAVAEKESVRGTTWGEYSVVGTWDGRRLTVADTPGPPARPDPPPTDFSTPCPAPSSGWAVVDPAAATTKAQDAAIAYARSRPDFAGAWVDQAINPASKKPGGGSEGEMNDPTKLVLNLRFTKDPAAHEAELRKLWGGALCVSRAHFPMHELESAQRTLDDELDPVQSSIDEIRGVLEITVVVAPQGLQRSLDTRFGKGTVFVSSALRPVT